MGMPDLPGGLNVRRFFIAPSLLAEEQVNLPDDICRHFRVLRLKPGDQIELLDGLGQIARARIETITRQKTLVRIENRRQSRESALPVT
ncbi:MAG: hypothetical protein D6751_06765, partial [Deltaproteobacteria bacterium]